MSKNKQKSKEEWEKEFDRDIGSSVWIDLQKANKSQMTATVKMQTLKRFIAQALSQREAEVKEEIISILEEINESDEDLKYWLDKRDEEMNEALERKHYGNIQYDFKRGMQYAIGYLLSQLKNHDR